jgi:quercetin dioxygenase-like cupin family protein
MPRFVLKDRLSPVGGSRQETLFSSRHLRLTVHALEAGQASKETTPRGFVLVCAMSGDVWTSTNAHRNTLAPGDSAAIAPGTKYAFGATEASIVVEIEAPGPDGDAAGGSAAKPGAADVVRASALPPFSAERFVRHPLLDSRDVRCDYLLLEAGQSLPPHTLPCDVAFIVREGRIVGTIGADEEEAGPGEIVVARAGETRGIRALEKSIVLQAVAPKPGLDMRREVAELVAPEPLRDDD